MKFGIGHACHFDVVPEDTESPGKVEQLMRVIASRRRKWQSSDYEASNPINFQAINSSGRSKIGNAFAPRFRSAGIRPAIRPG
jgi:hypothetical protein